MKLPFFKIIYIYNNYIYILCTLVACCFLSALPPPITQVFQGADTSVSRTLVTALGCMALSQTLALRRVAVGFRGNSTVERELRSFMGSHRIRPYLTGLDIRDVLVG